MGQDIEDQSRFTNTRPTSYKLKISGLTVKSRSLLPPGASNRLSINVGTFGGSVLPLHTHDTQVFLTPAQVFSRIVLSFQLSSFCAASSLL